MYLVGTSGSVDLASDKFFVAIVTFELATVRGERTVDEKQRVLWERDICRNSHHVKNGVNSLGIHVLQRV